MAIQDSILGYLKGKSREVVSVEQEIYEGVIKTFSFTSLGGGSGSSMLILYLAQFLAREKQKQVCVLDLNLLEPDLLYHFNVDVTTENTLMNYFKGRSKLSDCFIQDESLKNLHIVTNSPKDDPLMVLSIGEDERIISNLVESLEVFDYVLINLPYELNSLSFAGAVGEVDRGYVVMDERLSSVVKLKRFLDNLHTFYGKSNNFNKVVLNKRTDHDYPYEQLEVAKSELVTEIPFESELVHMMNTKVDLYKQDLTKEFQGGLIDVLEDMIK